VPTISTFYGIVIRMYFNDHRPPHFHALAGGRQARIAIATGEVIDGDLPRRAAQLVREWTDLRRSELEANWRRVEHMLPLQPIEPLP
jgi:hypothetical protein